MKWLALLLVAGCAGRTGEILNDTGDLSEATGRPRVDGIVELGGGDVVLTAPVQASGPGDGVATVGEALWVRGADFGRQPTVTIAGRPAAVLARTVDGGLLARVPVGVPVGAQTLTVANQQGHGDRVLALRRLVAALPAAGGTLMVAELTTNGPRSVGALPAPGQQVRIGSDGRAAYVLDDQTDKLTVFELPAQGGPHRSITVDCGAAAGRAVVERGPVIAFAAAAVAPVLMILRSRELLLLDTTTPLRPVRSQPRMLPTSIQHGQAVAAALSPDGRKAAVLLEEGNRLALLDLGRPGTVSLLAELPLAAEARVPVVVDVGFVADGRTVWVALGDTAKSRAVGPQPTELVALRIAPGAEPGVGTNSAGPSAAALVVTRRVQLPEARSPVRLNTGRALPLSSGASIRLPPERAAVYLTAHNRTGTAVVFRLGADDHATSFVEVTGEAGAADLSPDGRWLLVPAGQPSGRLNMVAAPADEHPGAPQVVDLGAAPPPASATHLPSVACQP